jgi:hypothetical protein
MVAMFVWLVENATVFYWLLGLTSLGLAAAWWSTRQRQWLFALAGTAGGLAVVAPLSALVDTDEKRIHRIVQEMAQGARSKNLDKIFQHVSRNFTHNGRNIEQFRDQAQHHMRYGHTEDLQLSRVQLVSRQGDMATVEFWATSSEVQGIRCVAEFVREGEAWKLKGFKLFLSTSENEVRIP